MERRREFHMSKKIVFSCIILAILCFGISFFFIFQNKESKEEKNPNLPHHQTKPPYNISLIENENFELSSENYDNNVNILIKSKKKYSSFNVTYKCYNAKEELIQESAQWVNNVDAGDYISNYLTIDKEQVKKIEVEIINPIYDNTLQFLDKDQISFITNDIHDGNKVTINLTAKNVFNTNLNFILGFLSFYQDNKLVKAVPFQIENIKDKENIAATVNIENIDKYNNIKVSINALG